MGLSFAAPLAGRDAEAGEAVKDATISIHAPLAGRDLTAEFLMCGAG